MKSSLFSLHHQSQRSKAVTLLESLCVILILSLLLALAAPPMLSIIRASRLTAAGEFLTGKLVEAQGLAITFSSDVELRFYKAPSAVTADGRSGQAVQLFHWVEGDADASSTEEETSHAATQLEKIGPRETLPDGIALSENPDFSSVWTLPSEEELAADGSREYVAIRFRPDGSTDLPEVGVWHFTLIEHPAVSSEKLPVNFYTVQIDPVTAKLEVYRPE